MEQAVEPHTDVEGGTFGHHPRHQPLAAAWDDEVDQPGGAQHGADEAAVRRRRNLHGGFRQPGDA